MFLRNVLEVVLMGPVVRGVLVGVLVAAKEKSAATLPQEFVVTRGKLSVAVNALIQRNKSVVRVILQTNVTMPRFPLKGERQEL
jgi:hypothetical protein